MSTTSIIATTVLLLCLVWAIQNKLNELTQFLGRLVQFLSALVLACVLLGEYILESPLVRLAAGFVLRTVWSLIDALMSLPTHIAEKLFPGYIAALNSDDNADLEECQEQAFENPEIVTQCSGTTRLGRRCRKVMKRPEGTLYDCGRHGN
ncbi:Nn.00g007320.m01.CDS01 [Neocucurbitaria sp. VM-36]